MRLISLLLVLTIPLAAGTITFVPGYPPAVFASISASASSSCSEPWNCPHPMYDSRSDWGTYSITFLGGSGSGSFTWLLEANGDSYPYNAGNAHASASVSGAWVESYRLPSYGSATLPMTFGVPITGHYSLSASASSAGASVQSYATIGIVDVFDATGTRVNPVTIEFSFTSDSVAAVPEPATTIPLIIAFAAAGLFANRRAAIR